MDSTAVRSTRFSHSTRTAALLAAAVTCLLLLVTLIAPLKAYAATSPDLGTASGYAVLAGSEITNTGPSVVNNDVGVSPGTAITGFPPGIINNGTAHSADAATAQAQDDLTTAYNNAAGQPVTATVGPELGGFTLVPGVYGSGGGTLEITGPLTLNAQGDPNAVFIFKSASTLITASNSSVNLINGAQACNVFWQVGSSATLGTDTDFVGTIMALTSITAQTGATIAGRTLARNGAVTLDTNVFTSAECGAPTESPTPTVTVTPTVTAPPVTVTPTVTATPPVTVTPTVTASPPVTVTPTATETSSESATETSSESATETSSESATETSSESATEVGTATSSSTTTGGALARTGSSELITIIGVGGALLLLGGGTLLAIRARTRTRGRHTL